MQEQWTAVDRYFEELLVRPEPALAAALAASAAAGLPAIQVSPAHGKLLRLLAQMRPTRAILEIGTLGGYSAIWLAGGLQPGGRMISLEADPRHAAVARANLERAGLAAAVEVRLGWAADSLPQLLQAGRGPFDLIFIDADKPSLPDYFQWAMKLSQPGTLIIVDNVVRNGAVADAASTDPAVLGVRRFNALAAAEPRVSATALQTVGAKGYDGLALLWVTG